MDKVLDTCRFQLVHASGSAGYDEHGAAVQGLESGNCIFRIFIIARTAARCKTPPAPGWPGSQMCIRDRFHTGVPAVNAAIKAILKTDVLSDYEVCRYIQLENGLYADVYSLEIIIPVAFRLNTYCTHVFRTWLVCKALSNEKRQAYVMFIQNGKAGYC